LSGIVPPAENTGGGAVALRWSESFGWTTNGNDPFTYAGWLNGAAVNASIGTNATLGDNAWQLTGNNSGFAYRYLGAEYSSGVFGFRAQMDGQIFVCLSDQSAGVQAGVQITQQGAITAFRGNPQSGGTVLGSAQVAPLLGFNYFEMGLTVGSAAGAIALRINGAVVLSLSNVNTQGASTTTFGSVNVSPGYFNQHAQFAHMYFSDATAPEYLGPIRVQWQAPVSDAAVQFTPTPSTDANWQVAATVPPAPATDYNSSSTDGAQDTFNFGTIDPTMTQVFGVTVKSIWAISTSGARDMENVCNSGTASAAGVSSALSTSFLQQADAFDTDPATGAAWTIAGVNAATFGYRISA
jgi:hypothetical protein